MNFSHRTAWPASPNAIAQAVERRRAGGSPFIDLTETNPTRVGLPPLPNEILEILASSSAGIYSPEPFGLPTAREAIAACHGHRVPPGHICLTASTSEAYAWVLKLLCDPGDAVLWPVPSYPLFDDLAQLESVRGLVYPLRSWDDWSIDFDALSAVIDDRTRAVFLVSPNNPTGSLLHAGDLPRLVALCRERRLALVADEVFSDFIVRADGRAVSLAGLDDVLTFVLSGLSKACLAPQLKVGWMAVSGPAPERDEALRRLELIADTYLSVGTPAQLAVPALLARRREIAGPLRARLLINRLRLERALAPTAFSVLPADGGWSAVLRVPKTRSEESWVLALLDEAGVLVHPGFFFDFPEEGFLVASLIQEEALFAEGARKMRERALAG